MPLNLIKPTALLRGDKIAALTLSWGGPAVFPARYQLGKQRVKDVLGLETIEMPHTLATPDFLRSNPKNRAEDLMRAFQDPSIKAIIATIGGTDAIAILPYIDYEIIKNNPKIVLGFSDTTVIHFICLKAGISSFYGTSIMCEFSENVAIPSYTFQHLQSSLFNTQALGEIIPSELLSDEYLDWSVADNQSKQRIWEKAEEWLFLQGEGQASGQLIGGCLETLDKLIDTAVWPEFDIWRDTILFIEISEEKPTPQMVEEMLLKLVSRNIFSVIKGIIFGYPGGQVLKDDLQAYDQSILNVCKTAEREALPVITRMNFGHTIPTFVIPYGATATIDCAAKKFSIISSHCVAHSHISADENEEKRCENIKNKLSLTHHNNLNYLLSKRAVLAQTNDSPTIHRLFQPVNEGAIKEHLIALLQAVSTKNEIRSTILLDSLRQSSNFFQQYEDILNTIKQTAYAQEMSQSKC
jgi:muramoyltetrapeptide carboxypeptidase LdcA involved in peptidoglycan recycling